ncbi:enterobactin exporter EntS [Photorhabdus namnaonensis]|uniref:Enterobactin exporter EntS n=2 Tax=Photorhabdus namnaonensis TaxID=1851568 RepID=A0A1B8YBK9_9GAMM|nr:enterobactin exporter EntS [Photorhabdus namnaonensis]
MIHRIILARFFSVFSEAFVMFAVPVLVYTSTNSASLSSFAFGLERLFRVISLPISGWMGDRMHTLVMLFLSDILRSLVCLFLFILSFIYSDNNIVYIIIPLSCVLSFFSGAGYVNLEGFVSKNMSAIELPSVNSRLQFVEQFTYIAAPAVVGLLVYKFSVYAVFAFAFFPFLISSLIWFQLQRKNQIEEHANREGYNLPAIFKFLMGNPSLLRVIGLTFLMNVMQGAILSTAVYVITSVFSQPEGSYAQLLAYAGLVNCCVFFIAPKLCRVFDVRIVGVTAFLIALCGLTLFATGPLFVVYTLGFLLVIGAEGCFNLFSRSYRASLIPKQRFSQYLGVVLVLNQLATPLTSFICANLLNYFSYNSIYLIFSAFVLFMFVIINPYRSLKFNLHNSQ